MAKKITTLKKELIEEVFSPIELDNIMGEQGYYLVEIEDDDEEEKTDIVTVKYTNNKIQIWVEATIDDENNLLVVNVKRVNNINNKAPTKVYPFKTFEDLKNIFEYFKETEQIDHWYCAWLEMSLGRRIGDTVSLKWSDLLLPNGDFKEDIVTLKEEKTDKIVPVPINVLAIAGTKEYWKMCKIHPLEHYNEKIFSTKEAAFRKALKKAVKTVGLNYPISTHSFRKFYANEIYKMHPSDKDRLKILQIMLGHSCEEMTVGYLMEFSDKVRKFNNNFGEMMLDRFNGVETDISNSPVVSFKSEDFREILSQCWEMAQSGEGKFEGLNKIISIAESKMV